MTKAFGYLRCSSNSESAAASIATQNDAITRAAVSGGVHLQRVFTDIGPAGSGQSELEHLLTTAEASNVRAIVVASKTRLTRSVVELERLEDRLRAAGIEIVSAEGQDWLRVTERLCELHEQTTASVTDTGFTRRESTE